MKMKMKMKMKTNKKIIMQNFKQKNLGLTISMSKNRILVDSEKTNNDERYRQKIKISKKA